MVILGIKLTHDGAVALIEDGVLKFCTEIEKINNNVRHKEICDLSIIPEIIRSNGYGIGNIDYVAIDGWHGVEEFWGGSSSITLKHGSKNLMLNVAPYNEKSLSENILQRFLYSQNITLDNRKFEYSSFMHVSGHVAGAYCSSPFAKSGESSYILAWDGGQYPRLYYFEAKTNEIKNLGHLFMFLGTIYGIFPQYFGPYKKSQAQLKIDKSEKRIEGFFGGYTVPGKIMAYIALGKVKPELLEIFSKVHRKNVVVNNEFEHLFSQTIRKLVRKEIYRDEDVLATMHKYLEDLLLSTLDQKISKYPQYERNLCFSGGSGLNIKWNSKIRSSGLFKSMYVPPFPNDSGSAIGVACCEYLFQTNKSNITWNVYSGPDVKINSPSEGWSRQNFSVEELARHMHLTGEPVVVLNSRAELGARALGNRSILAPATSPKMKDLLNEVKGRESYRPVAPMCLEEEASKVFAPGCSDPYMLFEHFVRT